MKAAQTSRGFYPIKGSKAQRRDVQKAKVWDERKAKVHQLLPSRPIVVVPALPHHRGQDSQNTPGVLYVAQKIMSSRTVRSGSCQGSLVDLEVVRTSFLRS